jgi:hypothetical protein
MVKTIVNDSKGMVQYAGENGTTFENNLNSPGPVTLGTTPVLMELAARINTGVLNTPIIHTGPPPAAGSGAGTHTITAAEIATGYVTVTGTGADTAVTLPSAADFMQVFGSTVPYNTADLTLGDSIEWCLHNDATNVLFTLSIQSNDGAGTPSGQQQRVAANSTDQSTSLVAGPPVARFRSIVQDISGVNPVIYTWRL